MLDKRTKVISFSHDSLATTLKEYFKYLEKELNRLKTQIDYQKPNKGINRYNKNVSPLIEGRIYKSKLKYK